MVGDAEFFAVGGVGELLGEGREVVLAGFVLNVSDQEGALSDQEAATAEEIAGLTHAAGIDVGLCESAAA